MHDVVYPIAAVVGWIAVGYKLLDLRKDWHNQGVRAVCAALFFPAVAFTLATPAIYAPVDRLIGFPNMGKLLVHGSLVIFSAMVQRMLLIWTWPIEEARPRVRRRLAAAGVVLVVMTVLLVLAPVDAHVEHFAETYAETPWVAEYLLIYLGAVGVAMAEISRLCWSFAKVAGRPWLVRGLNITAVGAAIGIGYCLTKGGYVIGRNLGMHLDLLAASAPAFAAVGGVLVSIGLTMPAWGPRLSEAGELLGRYRAYRALAPLWRALLEATPDIELPSGRQYRWSTTDLQFRVLRRVIEIRDARLGLREYLDPAVAEAAGALSQQAGLSQDEASAVQEAALLRAALQARAEGRVIGQPHPDTAAEAEESESMLSDAGLRKETDWLVLVAQAFEHSPIVRTTAAPMDRTVTA